MTEKSYIDWSALERGHVEFKSQGCETGRIGSDLNIGQPAPAGTVNARRRESRLPLWAFALLWGLKGALFLAVCLAIVLWAVVCLLLGVWKVLTWPRRLWR